MLSWRRIGPILLTSASCSHCSFQGISSTCWAYFLDVMVLPGFKKAVVDQTGSRPPVTMTFFWCKFNFGKCFGDASGSNHWTGHYQLSYKTHLALHMTIQSRNDSLLLCKIREDDTSKQRFIFIFSQLMKYPLTKIFHLSNLLQMLNNHRIVGTDFLSTSHVCIRGSASVMTLSWSLPTSNGQPLRSSSSRFFSSLQNLNHHCVVYVLAVPGPNALLMLQVVSAALQPILNSNKKVAWICFLLHHFFNLK